MISPSPLVRHSWLWRGLAFTLPTLLLFVLLVDLRVAALQADFRQMAGQAVEALSRADRHSAAMLDMLALTYRGRSDLEAARLSRLTASIRRANPAIRSIAFAAWVPAEEARSTGGRAQAARPALRLAAQGPHGLAPGREGSLSVRFVDPPDAPLSRWLGRDLRHDAGAGAALARLIDAGRPTLLPDWSPGDGLDDEIFHGVATYGGLSAPPSREDRLSRVDGVFLLGLSPAALAAGLKQRFPSLRFVLVRGRVAAAPPRRHSDFLVLPGEGTLLRLELQRPVFAGSRVLHVGWPLTVSALLRPSVVLPPFGLGLTMLVLVVALQKRIQASEESRRKGEELERERHRADGALRSISDAVIMLDEDYRVRYLNRVAEEMLGCPAEEAAGRPVDQLLELIDVPNECALQELHGWLERMCAGETGPEVLLNNQFREQVPVNIRVSRLEGHEHGGMVLAIRDTSQEYELNARLSYQASHDDLTGLLNRSAFEQRVRAVLSQQDGGAVIHALVFVDLDRFKLINDTYGHEAGDRLLRMVTEVLQHALRDEDCIGRMGGDEFAVLMRAPDMTIVGELADRLRKRLESMRFLWSGHVIDVHASLGVVPVDPELGDFEEIMKNADMACHAAKEAGRNTVHVFQPDDRVVGERRRQIQWLPRLQQALDNDQFVLYRQAIWPVRESGRDEPAFYEFLVRLRDGDDTDIAPGLFLPAAERFDMMRCLDRRVIALAMEAMGDPDCMPPGSRCTVNLSGQTLTDEGLVDYIAEQARRCGVAPDRVCFEITETAAITNLQVARRLAGRLRAMGFRLMLDDFGAGMSSLGYLHNLQVDYIKIDGQFVRNAVTDPLSAVSVRMVCEIAQVLGLETIAEMIEDDATVLTMREYGVDYLQGFDLSRPEAVPRSRRLRLAHSR